MPRGGEEGIRRGDGDGAVMGREEKEEGGYEEGEGDGEREDDGDDDDDDDDDDDERSTPTATTKI